MNVTRIVLAALGATVAYFAIGFVGFTVLPLKDEFSKYPAIYRQHQDIMRVFPIGMAAMFVGMVVLAVLYAMLRQSGSGLAGGARFGALIGLFVVCAFVVHNYVNLNIGAKLTAEQAVAYFVEWLAVGIAIGLIYKPAGTP